MEDKEVNVINIQLIATYLFIFSLFISLIITYNNKYKVLYKKRLLNDSTSYIISVLNRLLILGISLTFLYANIKNKELSKNKDNIDAFNLQITASVLTLIAAIIVTYVVIISGEYSIITSSENPEL